MFRNTQTRAQIKFVLRYARYALSALAAVGFGINWPGSPGTGSTGWGINFN
jgi:hypothetical protein